MGFKNTVKAIARQFGYDIRRTLSPKVGADPFADMARFLRSHPEPLILDVGANAGQTARRFKREFPVSRIHCFEPSPTTFLELGREVSGMDGVSCHNQAMGSGEGMAPFLENELSVMSSFLEPSTGAFGRVRKTTEVAVTTVDAFARAHAIPYVHILKSDTQGFELEVFKGAEELIRENRIGLIYCEVIFSDLYKGGPQAHEVAGFLRGRGFLLVSTYDIQFRDDVASRADMLFISSDLYHRSISESPWIRPAGGGGNP